MFARGKAALTAVLAVVAAGGCGSGSSAGADIQVVADGSWCKQDPVVGNVDVNVKLRNDGTAAGKVEVLPVRYYDNGDKNRSLADSMSSDDIAAGASTEFWNSFKVDDGKTVVKCGLLIKGKETEIPVR